MLWLDCLLELEQKQKNNMKLVLTKSEFADSVMNFLRQAMASGEMDSVPNLDKAFRDCVMETMPEQIEISDNDAENEKKLIAAVTAFHSWFKVNGARYGVDVAVDVVFEDLPLGSVAGKRATGHVFPLTPVDKKDLN